MGTFLACPILERMLIMEKLRVDNGLKKIEVNDNGEYIEFSISDNRFVEGLGELVDWMDSVSKQKNEEAKEDTERTIEDMLNKRKDKNKICQEACTRIDNLFGEGTCKKVFGNIEPDDYLIGDFIEKIMDLVNKFQKERKESIKNKYSNQRKGANSK